MNNLEIYDKVRSVPIEAKKEIKGGRLKGMTDINPMWRIKCLTEQFGPCGVGWYYVIKDRWIETCMAKDEITANIKIDLFYKWEGEWSKPVEGIGGSMLVASESKGLYVNDECYKMALTDAISVACKALGMGADVYWGNDNTKYNDDKKDNFDEMMSKKITKTQLEILNKLADEAGVSTDSILQHFGISKLEDMTAGQYGTALNKIKATKDAKQ